MAVASTPRQPFAELGASRLQSLSSAKNRQNALTDLLSPGGKGKVSVLDSRITLSSPSKRPYSLSILEDDNDNSENVDPVTSPSIKRSKNIDGLPSPKAEGLVGLDVNGNSTSPLKHRSTPTPIAALSGPSSAPAGRVLQPKRVGQLSKKRSSLSPYKRVEPPQFCSNKNRSVGLSFSIDAAISGTLAKTPSSAAKSKDVSLLQDAMPNSWFFDIHEDTPDEEAAIMMEHSTCTLDISSDDEAGPSRAKDERGKENVPPVDGVSTSPSREVIPTKPRRSVHDDAMADEGEERAPLGALPAEDFYAQGLDKDSVEVITEVPEAHAHRTLATDDDDAVNGQATDKENVYDALDAIPSPTRRIRSIDASLASLKPDFVIAEDPVDPVDPQP